MAVAITLFWALGAYNRLMRLRSAVAQAFGSFDAHMLRLAAFLGEFGAAHEAQRADACGGDDPAMAALQGAATQLSACLAVARARPLEAGGIAALAAARDVLHTSWRGVAAALIGEPASAPAASGGGSDGVAMGSPPHWIARWNAHAQDNDQAVRIFNDAVAQYNAAVRQFPASVLAKVFGFKPARAL